MPFTLTIRAVVTLLDENDSHFVIQRVDAAGGAALGLAVGDRIMQSYATALRTPFDRVLAELDRDQFLRPAKARAMAFAEALVQTMSDRVSSSDEDGKVHPIFTLTVGERDHPDPGVRSFAVKASHTTQSMPEYLGAYLTN